MDYVCMCRGLNSFPHNELRASAYHRFSKSRFMSCYGVATVSRIDKIIGLFYRIASLLQGSFAKETYNLIDPTILSHPIMVFTRQVFTYHLSFFMIQIFKFASFILHDIFLSFLFYFDIIFHFSLAFSTWLSLLFTWLLFFTTVTHGQCTHVSRCSRVCTSSSLSLSAALSINSFR